MEALKTIKTSPYAVTSIGMRSRENLPLSNGIANVTLAQVKAN